MSSLFTYLGGVMVAAFFLVPYFAGAQNLDPSCILQATKAGPCKDKPYGPKYNAKCTTNTKDGPLQYEGYLGAPCKENDGTSFNVSGKCVPGNKCLCETCKADGDKEKDKDGKGKEMPPMLPMLPMPMPMMPMPMMPMTPQTQTDNCSFLNSFLGSEASSTANCQGFSSVTSLLDSFTTGATGTLEQLSDLASGVYNFIVTGSTRSETGTVPGTGTSFTPTVTMVSVTPVGTTVPDTSSVQYGTDSDTSQYGPFSGQGSTADSGFVANIMRTLQAMSSSLSSMGQAGLSYVSSFLLALQRTLSL